MNSWATTCEPPASLRAQINTRPPPGTAPASAFDGADVARGWPIGWPREPMRCRVIVPSAVASSAASPVESDAAPIGVSASESG